MRRGGDLCDILILVSLTIKFTQNIFVISLRIRTLFSSSDRSVSLERKLRMMKDKKIIMRM